MLKLQAKLAAAHAASLVDLVESQGHAIAARGADERQRTGQGADRAARNVGFAIFLVVFLWIAALHAWGPHWPLSRFVTRLERDLRLVETLFLATTIVAVRYYGIELGRNLKGLAAGMCLYVGISLICLALFNFVGHRFDFTEVQTETTTTVEG